MASEFQKIFQLYKNAKRVIGLGEPTKLQKLILILNILNLIFLNLTMFWTFYTKHGENDRLGLIQYGFLGSGTFMVLLVFLFFLSNQERFEGLLKWCHNVHINNAEHCYKNAAHRSWATFQRLLFYLPLAALGFDGFQSVVMSIKKNRLEPFVPGLIPLWRQQTFVNQLIVLCSDWFLTVTLFISFGTIIGIIYISLYHFIAVLEALQLKFRDLQLASSMKVFTAKIQQVTDTYCDLIDQQNKLIDLVSGLMLIFEVLTYFIVLLIWIVLFFDRQLIFLGLVMAGVGVLYFMICWINEKLVDAYTDLRFTIYGLAWYEMGAHQRKMLLPIIIMTGQPKLLSAGGFHVISFKTTAVMVNRIYRCGLIINDLVGR